MGKKLSDKVLLILVILSCIGFTWFVSGGQIQTMIYNFVFLALMIVLCIVGMIAGFGKMGKLEDAFDRASD
ncbi:MAG: hypothetical protein ACI4EI_05540, partial [Muricoprocola sp.]